MKSSKWHKQEFQLLLEGAPRQEPACPHFTEGCGGCLLQDHRYEDQIAAKEAYLSQLYDAPVKVRSCPQPLGYRSRMDFVTAFGKMGLRKRGRFAHVVDIQDCPLLPEHVRPIHRKARELLLGTGEQSERRRNDSDCGGLATYNYVRHEGFVRYLVVRTSSATKQTMLIITTKKPADDAQRAQVEQLLTSIFEQTGVESLHWTINDGLGDVSVGSPFWHAGSPHIIDEIAGTKFLITPQTFFQGNPAMAGTLFQDALAHASGSLLDLFCGVGVLSILAARQERISKVVGVDLNDQSVLMAQENKRLNGADACEFVCADAAKYLATRKERFDTVICDPARPGLGREACALLLAAKPQRIIYISCNPLSHKEDLALLSQRYAVKLLEAYDLFPQTPHVEMLSVLERKT